MIHLEGQSPPDEFDIYGPRIVPFYNYLQAAFVLFEDGRVPAEGVLRVAVELVVMHRFDGEGLARSYLELGRRGHLRGTRVDTLRHAVDEWTAEEKVPAERELRRMVQILPDHAEVARGSILPPPQMPDYVTLVDKHNPRDRKKQKRS